MFMELCKDFEYQVKVSVFSVDNEESDDLQTWE